MKVVRLIALVCLLPLAGAAQQAQVRWMSIEEVAKGFGEESPKNTDRHVYRLVRMVP